MHAYFYLHYSEDGRPDGEYDAGIHRVAQAAGCRRLHGPYLASPYMARILPKDSISRDFCAPLGDV